MIADCSIMHDVSKVFDVRYSKSQNDIMILAKSTEINAEFSFAEFCLNRYAAEQLAYTILEACKKIDYQDYLVNDIEEL